MPTLTELGIVALPDPARSIFRWHSQQCIAKRKSDIRIGNANCDPWEHMLLLGEIGQIAGTETPG